MDLYKINQFTQRERFKCEIEICFVTEIPQRQGISFGSNETLVICSNGGADTEKVSREKSQVRYSWTTS